MKKNVVLVINIMLFIVIIAVVCLLTIWMANDEDWQPYESKTEKLDINLKSDIYNLAAVNDEISDVVAEYHSNLELADADYYMSQKEGEKLQIKYVGKGSKFLWKNTYISIYITIDIDTQKLTQIFYQKGGDKRVFEYLNNQMDKIIDISALDVYNDLYSKSSFNALLNENTTVKINYDENIITVYFVNDVTNEILKEYKYKDLSEKEDG